MGLARLTVGCALGLLSVCACTAPTSGPSPTSSPAAPCTPSGAVTDLGSLALDSAPRQYIRAPAGWYLLTASGFPHGGVLDPPIGRTTVVWGLATSPPRYDPGPAAVSGGAGHVDVVEGESTWVQLPEAQLWFLNSNGVTINLQACPPATITVVPS